MLKLCSTLGGSTCLNQSSWLRGTDQPYELIVEGDGLIGSQIQIGFKYKKTDPGYVINLTTQTEEIKIVSVTNKKLVASFVLTKEMSFLIAKKLIPYSLEYSIFLDSYEGQRYLLDDGQITYVSVI